MATPSGNTNIVPLDCPQWVERHYLTGQNWIIFAEGCVARCFRNSYRPCEKPFAVDSARRPTRYHRGMPHLTGHDRSQTLLLPEALDDYAGPDNPVRFIDVFVDGLDRTEARFADVEPKPTGRPGYVARPGETL